MWMEGYVADILWTGLDYRWWGVL